MGKFDKKLGGILIKRGLIDEELHEELLTQGNVTGESLCATILEKEVIDESSLLGALSNGMTIGYLGYLMEISPDDRRPAYSAYFNALASPAALLPLLGAAIGDVLSLKAVFITAVLAAGLQLVFYHRLTHWERK